MVEELQRGRGRPRKGHGETVQAKVQALDRGMRALMAVSSLQSASLSAIAEYLSLPVATVHRLLITLEARGFVHFSAAEQRWSIGIMAYQVGARYLHRSSLQEYSRPEMRRLMQATGESVNLAIPDGVEVVFLDQVESTHPVRAFFSIGTRANMHVSGAGKAILSCMDEQTVRQLYSEVKFVLYTANTLNNVEMLVQELAEIRARGWSYDREERYASMSCIAAPIRDASGEPVAAISISGPSERFLPQRIEHFARQVTIAAAVISHHMGAQN